MPFYFSVYIGKEKAYAQCQKVENSKVETTKFFTHSSHVWCECSNAENHEWEFDENVKRKTEEEKRNWKEIPDINLFASEVTDLAKEHGYKKHETDGEGLVFTTENNVTIKLADGIAFILDYMMNEAMNVLKDWKNDITWADVTFCVYYDMYGNERKEVETWRMVIENNFHNREFEGVEYRRVSILYAWNCLQNGENGVFKYKTEKFTYKHGVFRDNENTGDTTKPDGERTEKETDEENIEKNIEKKLEHMCTLAYYHINMARPGNSCNDSKYSVCVIGKRESVEIGDNGYWEKKFYLNGCINKVSFVFLQDGSPTNKDGKWYHQLTFDLQLSEEEKKKIKDTVDLTIISLGAKKGEYDRWKVCLWVDGLDKEYFKLVLIKKEKGKYVMSAQDIKSLESCTNEENIA